jgi:hypothetical protein
MLFPTSFLIEEDKRMMCQLRGIKAVVYFRALELVFKVTLSMPMQ